MRRANIFFYIFFHILFNNLWKKCLLIKFLYDNFKKSYFLTLKLNLFLFADFNVSEVSFPFERCESDFYRGTEVAVMHERNGLPVWTTAWNNPLVSVMQNGEPRLQQCHYEASAATKLSYLWSYVLLRRQFVICLTSIMKFQCISRERELS